MTAVRLVLVRHGEAAAPWDEAHDPGLSPRGRQQAEAMAEALVAGCDPLPIVVSPLRRTRETAAALERRWGVTAQVDPRVGEVPSPTTDLAQRATWLRQLLATPPSELTDDLARWRDDVRAALTDLATDTVIVTHFVAIRVASGLADYTPDYCSRTVLEAGPGGLRLLERGDERLTVVR